MTPEQVLQASVQQQEAVCYLIGTPGEAVAESKEKGT